MDKPRHAPLPSYRFQVQVGKAFIGFRSISGIKLSAAFEPLAVGGCNNAPALLPMPVKDTGRLVMERGIFSVDTLKTLVPGACIGDEMVIQILDENSKPYVKYAAAKPVVESVELSKLDAMDSSVLIESLSVLHQGIKVI